MADRATFERRYMTKLTPREEKFAQHYVMNRDVISAWKAAGYDSREDDGTLSKRALKMLAKPSISLRLKELQDAAAEKEGITIQAVVQNFIKVFEKAMTQPKPDFTNANRAMENLSKYLGMEVHRSEIAQKITMGVEDEESLDAKIRRWADIVGMEITIPERNDVH